MNNYLKELGFENRNISIFESFSLCSVEMFYTYKYEALIEGFHFILYTTDNWNIKLIMFTPKGYQIYESFIAKPNYLKYYINKLIENYNSTL